MQFRLDDIHDLTKNQIRERTMAKFGSMVHYVVNERLDVFTKRMELIGIGECVQFGARRTWIELEDGSGPLNLTNSPFLETCSRPGVLDSFRSTLRCVVFR